METKEKQKLLRELKRKAKYVKTRLQHEEREDAIDNLAKETVQELHETGVALNHLTNKGTYGK